MFFRRKGWLRQEFDEKLINQIQHLKRDWDHNNHLLENSVQSVWPSECANQNFGS